MLDEWVRWRGKEKREGEGEKDRQSFLSLRAVERGGVQMKPIFLWLSPLKIFHLSVPVSWRLAPSQSAKCVCWLCIAVIYIGHWQHHLLTNVLHFCLLPSCQTTSTRSSLSLSLSEHSAAYFSLICPHCKVGCCDFLKKEKRIKGLSLS